MKARRLWSIFWVFFWMCAHAVAAGQAVQMEVKPYGMSLQPITRVWLDETGLATPEQVAALPDSSFVPQGSRRASPLGQRRAVWMRFDISSPPELASASYVMRVALLVVQQASLDRVSVYLQGAGNQWQGQHAGTSIANAQWPVRASRPAFALPLDPQQPTRVLVRVADAYGSWAGLSLWRASDWSEVQGVERTVIGAYLGVTVVVLLLAFANALTWREPVWLSYAASHVLMAAGQIALLGLLGALFLRQATALIEFLIFTLVPMASGATLFFAVYASQARRFAPHWAKLGWIWGAAMFVLSALAFAYPHAGYDMAGAQPIAVAHWYQRPDALMLLLMYSSFAGGAVGVAIYWITWRRGHALSGWLMLCLPVVLLSAVPQILYTAGFIERSMFSDYSFVGGLLFEAVLTMYVLQRASRMRASTQTRLQSLGLQDALTGLMPRQGATGKLEHLVALSRKRGLRLDILVAQIDNWAQLAREHGHEVADHAILFTAQHLASLRESGDAAVRIGPAAFMLVSPREGTESDVNAGATSIIANGFAANPVLAPHMKRDIRVWVAEVDAKHLDAANLLAAADRACASSQGSDMRRRIFALFGGATIATKPPEATPQAT